MSQLPPLPPAVLVLAAVLLLTALRQLTRVRIPIWAVMLAGAAAALLLGQIGPGAAAAAVNLDVIVFLFGMFVIGKALEESGLLQSWWRPRSSSWRPAPLSRSA